MGDNKQPIRKKAEPTVITKDASKGVLLWQAADGSLYVMNGAVDFDRALKGEYGENYKREIAGVVSKEILNIGISMIKAHPAAGVGTQLATIGFKMYLKGTASNIVDMTVVGKELTTSDILGNYAKEVKLSALGGSRGNFAGNSLVEQALNKTYKVKKFITSRDLGIATFKKKLNLAGTAIKLEGEIGFLSFGKTAEKVTIKYVKSKLKDKGEAVEEYDLSKYAESWEPVDVENFERFVKEGFSVTDAVNLVGKRQKNLTYTLTQIRDRLQTMPGPEKLRFDKHWSQLKTNIDKNLKDLGTIQTTKDALFPSAGQIFSRISKGQFPLQFGRFFTQIKGGVNLVYDVLDDSGDVVNAGASMLVESVVQDALASAISLWATGVDVTSAAWGAETKYASSAEVQTAMQRAARFEALNKTNRPDATYQVKPREIKIVGKNTVTSATVSATVKGGSPPTSNTQNSNTMPIGSWRNALYQPKF